MAVARLFGLNALLIPSIIRAQYLILGFFETCQSSFPYLRFMDGYREGSYVLPKYSRIANCAWVNHSSHYYTCPSWNFSQLWLDRQRTPVVKIRHCLIYSRAYLLHATPAPTPTEGCFLFFSLSIQRKRKRKKTKRD